MSEDSPPRTRSTGKLTLSETRRIFIPQRLGVSKSLEQRVTVQNDPLDILDDIAALSTGGRDISHDQLGRFRLSGTRFSRNNHGLRFFVRNKVLKHFFGDSKYVWWVGDLLALSTVLSDFIGRVERRKLLIRVDSDERSSKIGVDLVCAVAFAEVCRDSVVRDLGGRADQSQQMTDIRVWRNRPRHTFGKSTKSSTP